VKAVQWRCGFCSHCISRFMSIRDLGQWTLARRETLVGRTLLNCSSSTKKYGPPAFTSWNTHGQIACGYGRRCNRLETQTILCGYDSLPWKSLRDAVRYLQPKHMASDRSSREINMSSCVARVYQVCGSQPGNCHSPRSLRFDGALGAERQSLRVRKPCRRGRKRRRHGAQLFG